MKFHLRYGAVALALLGTVGMASAQSGYGQGDQNQSSGQSMKNSGKSKSQQNSGQNSGMSSGMDHGSGAGQQQALNLSDDQKQTIWQALGKQKSADKAPADFQASIGAQVPSQIKLHPLPQNATKQVPEAKKLQYAKLQNQVLLVDPSSKTVVDIISQ